MVEAWLVYYLGPTLIWFACLVGLGLFIVFITYLLDWLLGE
jgi:hypothetical protein